MPPENNLEPNKDSLEKTPETQLKQIRTFQGDVASALSRQNESLVSIQQTEALKRRASGFSVPQTEEKSEEHQNFLFLLIGTLFFIIVGIAGAWYGYQEYMERTAPPVLTVPENRFITPNSEMVLDVSLMDRLTFAEAFDNQVEGIKAGELKHVVLKKGVGETATLLTTAEFLSLLEARAAGSLVRSFDRLFMIGALGETRFIVIKLTSFENAFPGMLAWEETMAEDLIPLFANALDVKAIAPASVFRDVIIKNKDVRMLEVTASTTAEIATKPVLLYSFFDNSMLIITDRVETLETLLDRLARERLSR